MSRSQKQSRRQLIGLLLCFSLAMAPLAYIAAASNQHPTKPFGGGGGDTFTTVGHSHLIAFLQCGTLCKIVVGWIAGKVMQYGYDYYQQWWNNGQPNGGNYSGQPVGGGGGDTFSVGGGGGGGGFGPSVD